jgi:hypothetical protein
MKEIAEKLQMLERELKADKGPFTYFAIVRNGEAPDLWDLVVSAPWISANRMKGIRLIAERLKKYLSPQELLSISKIAALEEGHPYLRASRMFFSGLDGGFVYMSGNIINGLLLPESYVITSRVIGNNPATPVPPKTKKPLKRTGRKKKGSSGRRARRS